MLRQIMLITAMAIATLLLASCGDMLNQQAAKDRDLGHMVEENMATSNTFRDNFVSFGWDRITSSYKFVTKNISDAETAGKTGYNAMVLTLERNDTKVKTGRSAFTIAGFQDNVQIFQVTGGPGGVTIQVTLMGPYADQTYTPPGQAPPRR